MQGRRVNPMRPTKYQLALPIFIAAFLLLVADSMARFANAIETWMSGEELAKTFKGVTVDGHYVDGRKFSEVYADDNALQYFEGPVENTGHWSVIGSTFCTIYRGDLSGGCYRVTRRGANCFEFYFVARTEDQVRRRREGRPGWTARAWIRDQAATCEDTPSV